MKPKYNPRLARPTNCGIEYDHEAIPASKPTHALCGSMAKIDVLIDRLSKGEELHHPDDEKQTCSKIEEERTKRLCAVLIKGSRIKSLSDLD